MNNWLAACDTFSVPRLTNEIKKLWTTDMDINSFKKLVASMSRRLMMVIRKGADDPILINESMEYY